MMFFCGIGLLVNIDWGIFILLGRLDVFWRVESLIVDNFDFENNIGRVN